MHQRPYSLRSRPFKLLLSMLLPFLILWQIQSVLPTAARDAGQLQADRACMRFSLDQGQQAKTGAGVDGRFELHEVHTDRILATWQAAGSDTNSGWLYDIQNTYPEGSWVTVFFYAARQETAVPLAILNPAPGTSYGWIAPGECHAVELQFPPAWRSQTQIPLPPDEPKDDPIVDNPPAPVDAASPFSGLPDWQSRQSTELFFGKYLAWGDMDGDGDLDLAESFSEMSRDFGRLTGISGIRVYINENGVMARDPIWVETGEFLSLTSIAWGDVDGDGDLDLAASALGNPNRVYINQNGTINRNEVMLLGHNELSTHLAWGDANGDGLLDLAVANREAANQLYINQGGTLTDSQVITFGGKLDTSRLAWADYDRDSEGLLDLAVANRNGPNQLFINQAGTLSDDAVILLEGSYDTVDLAWGDVDGDGYLDLAVGNNNGADRLYLNEQGEQLTPDDTWQVDTASTTGLAWEDVNNDGQIDLTVLTADGDRLYLNQNGRLQSDADNPLTIDLDGTFLAWADVDGDGDRDLATANGATNNLYINQGISLQTQGRPIATGTSNTTNVNGDGVFSLRDVDNGYIGNITFVDQDGTLQRYNQSTLNLTLSPPKETSTLDVLAWGDVDGDGDLDLAIGESYGVSSIDFGGRIVIYENDRGILTRIPIAATPEIIPRALAWADVDGDGDLDLAVANNRQNAIYFNDGNGLTRTDVWYSADGEATTSVAWGDMDGDGDLDLAAANNGGPNVVYLNEGGTLIRLPVWESRETDATTSVAWGDVDGDGDLDLAVGNEGVNKLYLNHDGVLASLASWESQEELATAQVIWDDVDGDGDLDLVADSLVYLNNRNGRNQLANSYQTVTVKRPVVPDMTNFLVPSQILSETVIAIPFTLSDAENDTVAYVAGQYSLNGGGEWFTAVATDTITTNLVADGRTYTFKWDTFASGFFGQADNVVFRLLAYTQPPSSQTAISGTYRYPNSLPLNLQTPFVSAATLPFRLRGTQVQVVGTGHSLENGISDAVVYRRPENGLTAQLMRSPNLQPLLTDQEGFLGGRGALNIGDQLMALVPVSQSFRIPPQLLLDGNSTAEVTSLTRPPTTKFTAELWFLPTGSRGTLLSIGNDFWLSYENFVSSSIISVTLKGEAFTATLPSFRDGYPHHIAFSWDGQERENNVVLYLDGTAVSTATLAPGAVLTGQSLTIGKAHVGSLDEIRLWRTVRTAAQISDTLDITTGPFATSDLTLLTVRPEAQPDMVGYWPVGDSDAEALADLSGNQNHAALNGQASVAFKPLYSLYHTSAAISDTVQFTPVTKPGVQTLTVTEKNPLILFDLDVSLEWDGRSDTLFLQQLEDSFRHASALLYDVSNGQIALGQINLYHNKAYWGVADIVIFADNSLRPSAAIGGIVNSAVDDPDVQLDDISAYLPGQIRMGTSWDPYGENIADLGEDWTRALAHELAHYLLFLPDNYLGIQNDIFQRVVCPGSFMTSTSDPSFSEFLTPEEWKDGCLTTLAQKTTARSDWETIVKFYPMLQAPENPPIEGPPGLPLAVTYLVPWSVADETLPYPVRNFDIRNQLQERLRLPTAQAFLIKTQATTATNLDEPTDLSYLEDDTMIALGSPTGGGDRLRVRGAEPNDRLCIFDTQENEFYSGCIEAISGNTVALTALPLHEDYPAWNPSILAYASSPYTVMVTVTQALLDNEVLNVQLYPVHYGSVAGNAPAMPMQRDGDTHAQMLTVTLPAYEFAVRVWVEDRDNGRCPQNNAQPSSFSCIREAITVLRLNPENWDPQPPEDDGANTSIQPQLIYTPFTAGPDRTAIGGPDRTAIGGPDRTAIGGPDRTAIGGVVFLGNPDRTAIGGPDRTAIGGVEQIMLGNINAVAIGGASRFGNPDRTAIGGGDDTSTGAPSLSLNAPILSADAQVVIYSQEGFFADNGIESLQALAVVPQQDAHSWLVPVGQAYRVVLSEHNIDRFISFTYLQREVPEGYEHTLKIYFLPEMGTHWEQITGSVGLVQNLIVGPLRNENGIYAVMSTLDDMPTLSSGWNLIAYPLPDVRCISIDCDQEGMLTEANLTETQLADLAVYRTQCRDDALASLGNRVNGFLPSAGTDQIPEADPSEMENPIAVEILAPGSVYWIHITEGEEITPQFAPPRRLPDGTLPNCSALDLFIEQLSATPP